MANSFAPCKVRTLFLSLVFSCIIGLVHGQGGDFQVNPDDLCIQFGENAPVSLFDNDALPDVYSFEVFGLQTECFYISEAGTVVFSDIASEEFCCGVFEFVYMVMDGEGQIIGEAPVTVEVKCGKPDCGVVDLTMFLPEDNAFGEQSPAPCAPVCENAETLLTFPFNPLYTYQWNVPMGFTPGDNDAEVYVNFGAAGFANISLTVTDNFGVEESYTFCFDILEAPPAQFVSTGYACLNSAMTFENLFPSVADYQWDFGDGNTLSNNGQYVQHTYTMAGTYTVTLTATWPVYGDEGNTLCCCSSQMTMDVEVDELPGPTIECVSTLCEGDQATYTTNAENCSSYSWTATSANGTVITTGNTPEFTVNWGAGPVGIVTLEVSGCDGTYCDNPSTAIIPIISAVSDMTGEVVVCANSTHTYSVPKWPGVTYDWDVTGGNIVEENGHVITVNWGTGPVGNVNVNYYSEFLQSLPIHDADDCQGSAHLEVEIRPEFELFNFNAQVCEGDVTSISASSMPSSNYTWNITPATTFTDMGGFVMITWDGGPGVYTVTATSNDPSAYCNDELSTTVTVLEANPPLSISGPVEVCPNSTHYYEGVASQPGAVLEWTVTGGTVSPTQGDVVSINWGPGPNYEISVVQIVGDNPECTSDPITLDVDPIEINGPLAVSGTGNCTNNEEVYTLAPSQHSSAIIEWTVSPSSAGSIISGQGSDQVTVQWNNDPVPVTLTAVVNVCDDTDSATYNFTLNSPVQPVVVQDGYICPGGNGTLETTQTFSSYSWSTGDNTQSTTVSAGGWYDVTTVDVNGCEATAYFEAVESPSPIAAISSGDPQGICIGSGGSVDIVAQTNPNYNFTWYLTPPGGTTTIVQGPSTTSTYTHNEIGVPGTYTYYIVVEDNITGCTETSNVFNVFEDTCGGTQGCTHDPYTVMPTATPNTPDCNDLTFDANGSAGYSVFQWYFGDGNISGASSPSHSYDEAGCYSVVVEGRVPSNNQTGDCVVFDTLSVCVPLAARFDFEQVDCREFDFNDLSTFLAPDNITAATWDFDGVIVPATPNTTTTYTFPAAGSFTVTLTVENGAGCITSTSETVTVDAIGVPTASATPNPACAGETVSFSGSAANAVSYFWTFGDGASYTGQNPSHTYNVGDTYTVTLTVEDRAGCTESTSFDIEVFPGIPEAEITGVLEICEGDETTLTAPAGYTYAWSTGEVTQSIDVGAGTYDVTLTDGNGCERTLPEVEVIEIPAPVANITGDAYICDNGCITLSGNYDPSLNYTWYDDNLNPLPTGNVSEIEVCYWQLPATFILEVRNQFGCITYSDPFTVEPAISPTVAINNTGSGCAGEPNVLEAIPFDPGLNYLWSNGQTGATITVTAAGSYTVTVTDPVTGCYSTASTTIEPLPDLCSVPVGCYEACDPTELCIAPGLGSYQWYLDGTAIAGENGPCIMLNTTGEYTVMVTAPNGCSDTSGVVEVSIIDCSPDPCENVILSYSPSADADGNVNDCCVDVSYDIALPDGESIRFTTGDAEMSVAAGTLDPALTFQTNTSTEIRLTNAVAGQALPQGTLNDFMTLCVSNPTIDPQTVLVEWLDDLGNVLCTDSIQFHCPIEPPCLYLTEDEIYCEGGETFYTFTVCNPNSQTWDVGYIEISPLSPAGISVSPSGIVPASPITPGSCQTFTVNLSGAGIGGEVFCYQMVAHTEDPAMNPDALCCSLEEEICIEIPQCNPCDFVEVESVLPSAEGDCCYDVTLVNNYDPSFFDELHLISLSPNTSFTIDNPVGSGWFASGYNGTSVSFIPGVGFGNFVPGGSFQLPQICVQTDVAPNQQFVIQWMKDGEVWCESSFEVDCEPDCGYLFEETIECDPENNQWVYTAFVKNTASYPVSEAVISFPASSGLNVYNQTISLGVLNPGDTFGPISLVLGAPAQPGDEICFTVTLHEVSSDGLYLSCCNFAHCITLPDCGFTTSCLCDDSFYEAVAEGINCVQTGPGAYLFSLAGMAQLGDCDVARWSFGNQTGTDVVAVTEQHEVEFDSEGPFQVCVKVYRTDENGDKCSDIACKEVFPVFGVGAEPVVSIFPNPNDGVFKVMLENPDGLDVEMTLHDPLGRPVEQYQIPGNAKFEVLSIDLGGKQSQGLYLLNVKVGDAIIVRKVMISH